MAGTLAIVNGLNGTTMKTYNVGATTSVNGVTFDGAFWWMLIDDQYLLQMIIDSTDTLRTVKQIDISGQFGTTLSALGGITHNGLNLFIGYTRGDPGPPVSSLGGIAMFSKDGKNLSTIYESGNYFASPKRPNDLDYDGCRLWSCSGSLEAPIVGTLSCFDLQHGIVTNRGTTTSARQVLKAAAWNGINFFAYNSQATSDFLLVDREHITLQTIKTGAIANPAGACFGNNDYWSTSNLMRGYLDQCDGLWVGVVYN